MRQREFAYDIEGIGNKEIKKPMKKRGSVTLKYIPDKQVTSKSVTSK
jgi:hypothetical protein